MPTLTVSVALALLLDYKPSLWEEPLIQDRFGVLQGVEIPKGLKSKEDQALVASLFTRLNNESTLRTKKKILQGESSADITVWKLWVVSHWIPKINPVIEQVLEDENCHPKCLMKGDQLDAYPPGRLYIHSAAAAIACSLFGDSFLTPSRHVPPEMIESVSALGIHNWNRLKKQYLRARSKLEVLRKNSNALFSC